MENHFSNKLVALLYKSGQVWIAEEINFQEKKRQMSVLSTTK